MEDFSKILMEGASHFDIDIDRQISDRFFMFSDMLVEWNKRLNLTSIINMQDIIVKHFLDSLSIFPLLKEFNLPKNKLIDIGSGAGFPGIPLRLVQDKPYFLLVDSLAKRVDFLKEVISRLNLMDTDAIHGRAEELARLYNHRETYDIALVRAVATLPVIIEYSLPFVKLGGSFIAMKGRKSEEINQSKRALAELGGEIEEIREITLPYSDNQRTIIKIRKVRLSSTNYPRKTGKPSKHPLI